MKDPGARVEHVAITVNDLDAAVAWYRDRFGFEEVRRSHRPEHALKTAVIRLGDAFLEILRPDEPEAPAHQPTGLLPLLRAGGLNHLAISVPDVHAAYRRFRSDGEDVATELIENRLFFVRDPWGTLLEVKQSR